MAASVLSTAKSSWSTLSAFQDKSAGNVIKSADWDELAAAIILTQVTEKDGSSLRMGTGAPDNADGEDGDWYFRKDSSTIYRKASGSWAALTASIPDPLTIGTLNVTTLNTPTVPKFSSIVTGNYTATVGERVRYNASGGTFTITAPAAPTAGDRWGIKEGANSSALVAISGNGNFIEQPFIGQLATSFAYRKPYGALEWEFDGTQWRCISLSVRDSTQFDGSAAKTSNFTALKGSRYNYNASSGGFTFTAPASPVIGDRFAIKEVAGDATAVTIDGNSVNIENPSTGSVASSSFSHSVPYGSFEWEYDGTVWRCI